MFESVRFVAREHIDNKALIFKLAKNNMSKQTIRTTLGVWWVYIHDILYFSVMILFRVLMAGNGKIEGMNAVVYLMIGLIPWFFMNEVLGIGSNAIKVNKAIIQSIKFPISIIPTIEVTAIFLKRILTFLMIFFVVFYYGYIKNFNPFLFVYYVICMFLLMWAINFIICAFTAVSSDFQQLYMCVVRVMMFSLPIIWSFANIEEYKTLSLILRINPMAYVIEGFRRAFVTGGWPDITYTIYFWVVFVLLSLMGCFVQYRLRRYYADFM